MFPAGSVTFKALVVPYVGTWIEILFIAHLLLDRLGRSLRGNVDRNTTAPTVSTKKSGRSLRGNVDRNAASGGFSREIMRRSLRGNVDRNSMGGITFMCA